MLTKNLLGPAGIFGVNIFFGYKIYSKIVACSPKHTENEKTVLAEVQMLLLRTGL
jgi:hypothetical protein